MDRKILHIRIAVATTVGAIVLSAATCGQGLRAHENQELTVLIGPSGSDETDAVRSSVRNWADHSRYDATVDIAADVPGQLSEGFSSGDAADVFALDVDHLGRYMAQGFLLPYGEDLNSEGNSLGVSAEEFTADGELVCVPRDSAAAVHGVGLQVRESEEFAHSGPAQFTECWGIAANTRAPDAAVDLVRHLMSAEHPVAAPLDQARHRQ